MTWSQSRAEVLRRFYDTYYHPDNATVMVVGDVDEATALAEVERGFGDLPPAPGPIPQPVEHARASSAASAGSRCTGPASSAI